MTAWKKRPMAVGCTVFLLSTAMFLSLLSDWRLVCGAISLFFTVIGLILCRILGKRSGAPLVLLLPIALAAGLTALTVDLPACRLAETCHDGEIHSLRIRCLEEGYSADYGAEHRVQLCAVEDECIFSQAILVCSHELDLRVGDEILLRARIEKAGAVAHRFEQEYRTCPIILSEESDVQYLSFASIPIWERVSESFRRSLEQELSDESAGLSAALLLGKRDRLPEDVSLVFRNLGLSHVLAVSGLHLTLVLFFLEWTLKRLTCPLWLRDLCMIAGTIGYALLSGMSLSVLRAGGMLILARLSSRVYRESDPFTNLTVCLTVMTLISPYSVLDIGLLLSAFSTAGILYVTSGSRTVTFGGHKRLASLWNSIAVSTGALAATLPLSLTLFGTVSVMAIPANLLLSLPVSLCMIGGISFLLFGRLPVIGPLASAFAEFGCTLLLRLARGLDGGRNYLLAPGAASILVTCLAALSCFLLLRRKGKISRVLPALVAVAFLYVGTGAERMIAAPNAMVTFLSDGKDDGLIVSQAGLTLICDFSDGSYDPSAAEIDIARSVHGAAAPDGYLLSHYHQRSVNALYRLLRQIRVKTVLLPYPQTEVECELSERMTQIAAKFGTETVFYASDGASEVQIGEAVLRIRKENLPRSTHPTLRAQIVCRGRTVGYLGASAYEVDREECRTWMSMCDVLLFGSHGPIIKTKLPACGEGVFADLKTAQALAKEDGTVLSGFSDCYTVVIRP